MPSLYPVLNDAKMKEDLSALFVALRQSYERSHEQKIDGAAHAPLRRPALRHSLLTKSAVRRGMLLRLVASTDAKTNNAACCMLQQVKA